jgi:hypothetical protein
MRIDAAILDPQLLGAGLGDVATWRPWLAVLKAAFGLPLTEEELSFYKSVSSARGAHSAGFRALGYHRPAKWEVACSSRPRGFCGLLPRAPAIPRRSRDGSSSKCDAFAGQDRLSLCARLS